MDAVARAVRVDPVVGRDRARRGDHGVGRGHLHPAHLLADPAPRLPGPHQAHHRSGLVRGARGSKKKKRKGGKRGLGPLHGDAAANATHARSLCGRRPRSTTFCCRRPRTAPSGSSALPGAGAGAADCADYARRSPLAKHRLWFDEPEALQVFTDAPDVPVTSVCFDPSVRPFVADPKKRAPRCWRLT